MRGGGWVASEFVFAVDVDFRAVIAPCVAWLRQTAT